MGKLLRRLTRFLAFAVLAAAVGGAIWAYPFYEECRRTAESCDLAELHRIPAISEVYDAAGATYGRLPGEVRYVVPLARISPHFVRAVLAREDARFYEHGGVDFRGIVRAAVRNVRSGGIREGASTLTQQLARNTFDLGPDRWRRKLTEALLARRIEARFTKDEIFEAYANRIYYGVGIYGVETAARACFGKPAADLTLSEAAILAGLIRSPNRLSPLEDSRRALAQRDQVLARMAELAMISGDELRMARAEPVPAAKRPPPRVVENYAMDTILRDLEILLPKSEIDRGGLKIHTTIDRRLQLLAEAAVEENLSRLEVSPGWPHPPRGTAPRPRSTEGASEFVQGALVAIDNETGGIRALVGGRDFAESPFNRATLARRQVGSTFKPFVYAAAFARGLAPGQLIDDGPLREGEVAGLQRAWTPENSDRDDLGPQPVETGLIRSRNTMTVRVGEFATRAAVRRLAADAGLGSVPDQPAIYLGAFEATLKDLTAAYTMFPNDGVRRQPYLIDHIEDRHGRVIYRATRAELRCLSPEVDARVSGLLRTVVTEGTAAGAEKMGLRVPAAGKTGTTDNYRDAWFVGYTTRLTCGVWVGMDRPQRITDRGYGGRLALPVWVDFMTRASERTYLAKEFPPPAPAPSPVALPAAPDVAMAALPAEAVPVARAVPVDAAPGRTLPREAPAAASYRVIQTENGLRVIYGR